MRSGSGALSTRGTNLNTYIIMKKSDRLKSCFGEATFEVVLQFSQNNVFIELAFDRSAFWRRDLNSWALISDKK